MAWPTVKYPRQAPMAMAGSVGANRQNLLRQAMAAPQYGADDRPDLDFGTLDLRAGGIGGLPADRHGTVSQRQFGGLLNSAVSGHPMGTTYREDGTPEFRLPERGPVSRGIMPDGGPQAGQPYEIYNASAPAHPMADRLSMVRSAINRPLPPLPVADRRQLTASLYGTGTAGSGNGYISVPGGRDSSLRSQVAAQVAQNRMAPAGLGPYGGLGGSSSRAGSMLALINQPPGSPIQVDRPWDGALMAEVERQSADRNNPANIAMRRQLDQMQTPEYQANRSRQLAYNQNRDQKLAQTRGQLGMARGIAQSQARGMRLTPLQESFLAQAKGARQGNYAGGTQIAGKGLNTQMPFDKLQPVAKVDVTPEREQELLGILGGVNDSTPPDVVEGIRNQMLPGEMEHIISRYQPRNLEHLSSDAKVLQKRRLLEAAKRIRDGKSYQTPQQEADALYAADAMGLWSR